MLTKEDFKDSTILKTKTITLQSYELKASEMYQGRQHLSLMKGLTELREIYGGGIMDLAIISAGYGLLSEDDLIVPYEVTFSKMSPTEIKNLGRELNIKENLQRLIANYHMAIFILGDKYLKAIELPLEKIPKDTKLIFITSESGRKNIRAEDNCFPILYGQAEAKTFGYTSLELKGYIIKQLCHEIANNGTEILNNIYEDPYCIKNMLKKYEKIK